MVTVRRRDNANRMEDTMTVSIAPPSRPSQAETRRAIWNTIRGSSGNLVEWYDVYVYTVFATYFEDQFFDRADRKDLVAGGSGQSDHAGAAPGGDVPVDLVEKIRGQVAAPHDAGMRICVFA